MPIIFDNDFMYDVVIGRRTPDGTPVQEKYSNESYTSLGDGNVLSPFYGPDYFDGRVKNPGVIQLDLWGQGRTRGPRDIATGVAQLINTDGGLDPWLLYAFDGGGYSVYVAPRSDRENRKLVFAGMIEQEPILDQTQATLNVRDQMYRLQKQILDKQYAGTNALPNGLEGNATDLKGKTKPLVLGQVRNVSPPCVNTSIPVYQLSADTFGAGYAVSVYVNRVQLTPGVELGTQGDGSDNIAGPAIRNVAAMAAAVGSDGLPLYALFDADGTFPKTSHGYSQGDVLVLNNYTGPSGTLGLPAGLSNAQYYYVGFYNSQYFRLYTNRADAVTFGAAGRVYQDTTSPARNNSFEAWTNKTVRGHYDWYNQQNGPGFFIRTGTDTTAQQVTCDIRNPVNLPQPGGTGRIATGEGASPAGNGCQPQEILQYLLQRAEKGAARMVVATLGAYPDVGLWIDDNRSYLDAANALVSGLSAGFYYDTDTYGTVRLKQLKDPIAIAPVASYDQSDILSIQRINSSDDDRGIPAWRVTVQYNHNYTVQTAGELPGVALSDVGFTSQEYRSVSVSNDSTRSQWPQSPEIVVDSNIDTAADAINEANRLMALYGVRRDMMAIEVPLALAYTLSVGDVVKVTHPRFNLSTGQTFQVIGLEYNLRNGPTVTLTIWG